MSRITVDPLAKTIEVDDYIYLHSATDFVIRNATARNFALTVSTHQGIILFRVDNFVDDGTGLNYRTNLESDGLLKAFRHVPKSGCRRFLLNVHDRNASFSVQFSGEIMVWNDIASSMDMSAYALKTELFSGNYSDLTGAPDLSVYALKTEVGLQGPQGAAAISFAVLTAVTDEATFAGTAQLVNADGTAGETVNIVYDFAVPASGE